VPEIGTPGLMSGDGKRGVGHRPQATAPILDSTCLCENVKSREGQRTCFSDTAAPQFSMLLTLPKRASNGILFSAICSALRFYTGAPGDRQGVGGASPLR
jgi:hypothetical protein